MSVILAQDIVNAVIQDGQSKTTNRTALYDYVDRIQQRMLRESKWRFLLSDPKVFATLPGVASYNLTSGSAPSGSFQTNLALADFNNIAPGSVYNATSWQKIEEDTDDETTLNSIIARDGSLRAGNPRTYSLSIANPGVITLKPAPDANNFYYPVPETPVVGYTAGGTLPARTYYGVVTFVDSLGGESLQCTIPFTVVVPASNLLVVNPPNTVPGGISGSQAQYSFWNVYVGTSVGNYYLQNTSVLPIGGPAWTETVSGIFNGKFPVPSLINTPASTYLTISSTGQLAATVVSPAVVDYPWALVDGAGQWWQITTSGGFITATAIAQQAGVKTFQILYLYDTSNLHIWGITIQNGMLVVTQEPPTVSGNAIYINPPTTTTIQPLNAYIIQFRYYKSRVQIVNPTDVLQVPYAYKDIVIAGVNYLASLYLDERENREPAAKTMIWKRDFDAGLAQIRRDLRTNYRKVDFISPDRTSQYVVANQQGIPTMGW